MKMSKPEQIEINIITENMKLSDSTLEINSRTQKLIIMLILIITTLIGILFLYEFGIIYDVRNGNDHCNETKNCPIYGIIIFTIAVIILIISIIIIVTVSLVIIKIKESISQNR